MATLVYDGSEYTMDAGEAESLKKSIADAASAGLSIWLDMAGAGGEKVSVLVGPGIPMAFREGVDKGLGLG